MLACVATASRGQTALQPGAPSTVAAPAANADLQEAQLLIDKGHPEAAIASLQKLAGAQPPVKGAAHSLGIASYRTGKLVQAKSAFGQAIREDSADIESVQMEGLTLYRLGQPAAAIPYLERVRQWTPHANADASYVLGLCYLNAQRYDDARRAFAAQYGVAADSAAAYLILANMLQTANFPEMGADAARKAISLDRNLPLAHLLVGEVLLLKGDTAGAISEFEQERAANPGYGEVYNRLGDAYLRAGRFEDSQQSLMKALSLDTSSTGPFILMGKVFVTPRGPAVCCHVSAARGEDGPLQLHHPYPAQPGVSQARPRGRRAARDRARGEDPRQYRTQAGAGAVTTLHCVG